jgi:flavin reductase (DIM6/NTAB) family NADH-FMN oxidoreductase RutF
MRFDVASLSSDAAYKLLSSAVVPRPIAWLSTLNVNGSVNLAPFSFFNAVSGHPPMIAVSIEDRAPNVEKDSLVNIKRIGSFVSHVVTEGVLESVVTSAIEFPNDTSEIEVLGLKLTESSYISVPRLLDAPVSMECELETLLRAGGSATLVIARVVCFHVEDKLYNNERIDSTSLQAVGRMSGSEFTKTRERVSLPTPSYEAWLEKTKPRVNALEKQDDKKC